jgi:hypothetical protein
MVVISPVVAVEYCQHGSLSTDISDLAAVLLFIYATDV